MYYFEPRELDFISARLRLLIGAAHKKNSKQGVILTYEQLSCILDLTIITEAIITELIVRLVEHDVIVVNLGALFLVLDGKEATSYFKASKEMFTESMTDKICIF